MNEIFYFIIAAIGGAMIGFLLFCLFAVAAWTDDDEGGR